jgi:hypothetical protein
MNRLCFALPLLLLTSPDLLADTRDDALKLPNVVISANRQVQVGEGLFEIECNFFAGHGGYSGRR